MMKIEEFIH